MDIKTASDMLYELNLKMQLENYIVDVKQFRVSDMSKDVKKHKHSSYEYHIITNGRCRVNIDNGSFEVGPGDFYLTGPGVYHEQIGLSSGGYIEYSLNCELIPFDSCDSEISQIVKILTETECKAFKDTQNITKLFEQALYEAYHKNIGFYGYIKDIVHGILIRSARTMSSTITVYNTIGSMYKDNDFRLVQIERFIEDNIGVYLSTEDIARYMCLSEKQIYRIVKEKSGISTKNLILTLKLKKAKELLEDTDYSLKNISNLLGFESEIYFSQFFKKREGTTPGNYRDNIRLNSYTIKMSNNDNKQV
jgi:AraC-like DNA-binding protein